MKHGELEAALSEFRERKLPDQDEIAKQWQGWMPGTRPLASVLCITFNHAGFIEDALRGFLTQKTSFPFEIIIHDDASSDGTQDVIRRYVALYPDLIRPILQEVNQFSRGGKPVAVASQLVRGEFTAVCEGDDFWLDPLKLELQVKFLRENPDVVISGHDAAIIDDSGRLIKASKLPATHRRAYSAEDLVLGKAWILTMSWVYRSAAAHFPLEFYRVLNGDNFRVSLFGLSGKSWFHSDIIPAVYRTHAGGVWSALSEESRWDEKVNTSFWLYRYFKRIERAQPAAHYFNSFVRQVVFRVPLNVLTRELLLRLARLRQARRFLRRLKS